MLYYYIMLKVYYHIIMLGFVYILLLFYFSYIRKSQFVHDLLNLSSGV